MIFWNNDLSEYLLFNNNNNIEKTFFIMTFWIKKIKKKNLRNNKTKQNKKNFDEMNFHAQMTVRDFNF